MEKQCRHISVILIVAFFIQILFSSGIFFIANHVFAEQTSVDVKAANRSDNWISSLYTDTAAEFVEDLPSQLQDIFKSHPRLLKSPLERLSLNAERRNILSKTYPMEAEKPDEDQLTLLEEKVMNKIAVYMGEGIPENPYQIWNAEDLNNIRHDLSAHYIQMANIDLSEYSNWQPIENFTGVFDGNNKRISSLFINRPMENSIGLFGRIIRPAELKNIKLENINVTGNYFVGGLVGENGLYDVSPGGNIDNVHVSGSVTGFVFEDEYGWLVSGPTGGLIGVNLGGIISRAHSAVNVNAAETCGGLVGLNVPVFPSSLYPALISDSYATGNITLIDDPRTFGDYFGGLVGWNSGEIQRSYAAGNVYGKSTIGGLVGDNEGAISNSYATGNVTAIRYTAGGLIGFNIGYIDKCYSIGWTDAELYAGGLVGYSTEIIYNSYYDAETSGQSNTNGGEPRTTVQMKDINTFIGWDFENVWDIDAYIHDGYPFLRAIPGTPTIKDITGLNAAEEIAKRDPAQISLRSLISDPIDTSTGAQIIDLHLLTIKGAQPIVFSINYNSLLLKAGSLGKAWSHPFEVKLEFLSDDNINVLWNQNRKNLFLKENENKYFPEDYSVRFDTLTKKEDEGYELVRKDKTSYLFDSTGKLIEIINSNQFSIMFYYDEFNRLKEIIEPISNKKLILSYDDNNLIEKLTAPLNREVLFQYDANKNLTTITESIGATITYTHNHEGQILSATDSEEKQIFENTFDEYGRIISQKDGLEDNYPTIFAYDELTEPGKIITIVTDRNGNQKVLVHDSSYRLIQFGDELNFTTDFEFDDDGNLIRETDAKGNTTAYTYDERGNLLTITNALRNITRMTYDENDNLLSVKNEAGDITSFTYDDNQRLIRIQAVNPHTRCIREYYQLYL
ncbi:YD repeat-containing protein [Anaerovirgula multivorans]|uniref:YD repeat-containing protein n=1 Tax=Anaerovirgula multivorans TaxID=312168 RepID=A0A239FLW5_9FIRM|nr:GLUG motif-containing protein [Anaerovirgula multivorans]SNS57855.1 YD repeat-containing protein [Anaerovirgula multivorans]